MVFQRGLGESEIECTAASHSLDYPIMKLLGRQISLFDKIKLVANDVVLASCLGSFEMDSKVYYWSRSVQ